MTYFKRNEGTPSFLLSFYWKEGAGWCIILAWKSVLTAQEIVALTEKKRKAFAEKAVASVWQK